MDILPHVFRWCELCGMWCENNKYPVLKTFYKFFILGIILQFTSCEVIELFVMKGSLSEFTELLSLTTTYLTFCFKLLNFVLRKNEMIELLQLFRQPLCQASTKEEIEIVRKHNKTVAMIFFLSMGITLPTCVIMCLSPLMTPGEIQLPFKSYQILDLSNNVKFWISYAQQFMTGMYGASLNVTMDTMTFGFLILSAGQFEISCYRFANVKGSATKCIRHYLLARTIAFKIQAFFIRVIVPLFCFSLVTLCTSIFEMSQKRVGSYEFLSAVMYLMCMFYLLFLYCFFGNELQIQSSAVSDAVYSSDWIYSTSEEIKNRCFVMLFVQRGFKVSFHGQCTLSLKTFLWVTKTSYAALNLLQQVSVEEQ